jgi:hypothetical protein
MDLLGQVQPAGAPFLEGFAEGGNLGAKGADASVESGSEAGPVLGEMAPQRGRQVFEPVGADHGILERAEQFLQLFDGGIKLLLEPFREAGDENFQGVAEALAADAQLMEFRGLIGVGQHTLVEVCEERMELGEGEGAQGGIVVIAGLFQGFEEFVGGGVEVGSVLFGGLDEQELGGVALA